jgi:AraC-like DNA-binding protein
LCTQRKIAFVTAGRGLTAVASHKAAEEQPREEKQPWEEVMSNAISEAGRECSFALTAEPAGGKLRRWQTAIFETFGAIDTYIRDDIRFSGAMRRVSFPNFELTDVRSSSECARRTRRHLSGDKQEIVELLLIRHGNIQLDQYRRRSSHGPGTFTLLDLSEPYDWMHARPAHVIGIKLSRSALAARVGDLRPYVGSVRGTAAGLGRLTADFLELFASQATAIGESAGPALERQFLDLAELLLIAKDSDKSLPAMTPAEAIYNRALAFIDRHLSEADLAPAHIAEAMPVSLRYLHAIFRSFGTSVCDTILSRRLAYCHDCLSSDPQLRISQLAYLAGFKSHAHFSTAFKGKYGSSPRDFRREHAPVRRNGADGLSFVNG